MDSQSIMMIITVVAVVACCVMGWKWFHSGAEVIFFPDPKLPCNSFYRQLEGRNYTCPRANCTYAHYESQETSLMRLFLFLNEAKKSIDLCIFDFTFTPLADFLIAAGTRGILVRIITDAHVDRHQKSAEDDPARTAVPAQGDYKPGSNDQIPRLQTSGIQIRVPKSEGYSLMHNKFALVDGEGLVMGSFNWTKSAVTKNHEALIMTRDPRVVDKFAEKFAMIWKAAKNRPRSDNRSQ